MGDDLSLPGRREAHFESARATAKAHGEEPETGLRVVNVGMEDHGRGARHAAYVDVGHLASLIEREE